MSNSKKRNTEMKDILLQTSELRNKEGKLKEAVDILESVTPTDITNSDNKLEYYFQLGTLYRDLGKTENSKKLLRQGIQYAQKKKNNLYEAKLTNSLAFIILQKEKDYTRVKQLCNKALELLYNIDTDDALEVKSTSYAILGNTSEMQNKYDKAVRCYRKSSDLAKKANFIKRVITVRSDIGNVYLKKKKYKKALKILQPLLVLARKEYTHAVPAILIRLGRLHNELNNLSRAREVLEESIEICKKQGWTRSLEEAEEGMRKMENDD
jgi:tetratricopeptide (TPR) repeat protein